MKFKHTVDLICFLRKTYDLYEHTDYNPTLARKITGYPGVLGTGIPRKICDTVTDEKHDIIANLLYRGYSKYVSVGSITGLPLSYDEEKEYLLGKAMFRYSDGTKEFFKYKPDQESDQFDACFMWFFEESDMSLDEQYVVAQKQKQAILEEIDDYGFKNCKSLKHLYFNNQLVHIGKYCFSGCSNLQQINLPDPMVNKNTTFHGNPLLKSAREQVALTKEHIEELRKCMNDPVYFAENYIKIVNVDKGLMNIELYPYQRKILKALHEHRHNIVLSCR